ncbi:magnesium transporter CorA family protein [Priestia aryabhattai]|uniref:magnesium transporter CorA family protein n=1 Tax=Priestia aryabhattai TaxID=412384 RepID=UPI001C8E8F8D|nr:magnesium transporter CorA family protein [Priestia aryabhattai]MBY0029415.1 magnesium transporter CorA family protein [Priestia aryabhattai]
MNTVTSDQWKWYQFDLEEADGIADIIKDYQYPRDEWFCQQLQKKNSNHIQVDVIGESELIYGSLIYHKKSFDQRDYESFHFYITEEFIITAGIDLKILENTNHERMIERMKQSANTAESFFILLGEIMKKHLNGFDQFESHFRELLWEVRHNNNIDVLDDIHKARYDLLIWTNLISSVREVTMGIEEAFHKKINQTVEYQRMCKKIEIGLTLIEQYQKEFDALIKLEEVVSTHRGNEIMKALTLLTAISTPLTAFGALWGMNFKGMPELDLKFGYIYALILIVLSTVAIYLYLRMKGWTGDLLKGRKKNSFFK